MQNLLLAAAALIAVCGCTAHADEITLIAPGGIRAPLQKLIPDFERKTGHTVKATFGSGNGTKKQAMTGEPFDVPIVQPSLAEVVATGHVIPETETPLATVAVALAVRKGAPKPDISTPTALVGYVSTKAKSPEAAKALLKYLSGPEAAVVYKAMGMQAGK